jgi:hypothetical protein
MILTKPDNFQTRALVTLYVWVSRCSDYRYVSVIPEYISADETNTKADPGQTKEILENSVFRLLHPKGLLQENYSDLTRKVVYTFRDVYEQVGDSFDW